LGIALKTTFSTFNYLIAHQNMEQIEIIINSLRHLTKNLAWNGILAIICGIIIVIYPKILQILVSIMLIGFGIINLVAAIKVRRYSKIRFKI